MKISVNSIADKFFLYVSEYKKTIDKYVVEYSWKANNDLTEKPFNINLLEKHIELYGNVVNLISIPIEVESIPKNNDYIKLTLITKDNIRYPFYIEYNKFHNVPVLKDIYYHTLVNYKIKNTERTRYTFFIQGIYGDKHKINLKNIINEELLYFKVVDKSLLESNSYSLIIYKDSNIVYKGEFGIIKDKNIDFSIIHEEVGECFKIKIFPKLYTCCLDSITVKDKHNRIVAYKERKHGVENLRCIELYTNDKNHILDFDINYTIKEYYVNSKKEYFNINKKYFPYGNLPEITDLNYEYDHRSNSMKITWKNCSLLKRYYEISIGRDIFLTKDSTFIIKDFKNYDNNSKTIPLKISNKYYPNQNGVVNTFDLELPNIHFINYINKFTPTIDYSDVLYNDKVFGKLTWTTPGKKIYTKITANSEFIQKFLDEYQKPWLKDTVIDKTGEIFDSTYKNYDELLDFDFDSSGNTRKNSVNESFIPKYIVDNGFIITTNNYLELPIWTNEPDKKYKIKVELFNYLHEKIGEGTTEFGILEKHPTQLTDEFIKVKRNQYMQFGESGTIGEYYKIDKPTPKQTINMYGEGKTYLGGQLYDLSNIDFDNNSLYFYFNTLEGETLDFTYKRNCNFYKLNLKVFKKDEEALTEIFNEDHVPQGNDFSHNKIGIPKNIFKEGGIYNMKIQTFNSIGKESPIKEFNFYVYDSKPNTPEYKIKDEDVYTENDKTVINKKYFQIDILNNAESKEYRGYMYKEVHFFFKHQNQEFNPYPDYVVQSNKNDGTIILKNSVPIENGYYSCKIVAYDYSGNASDPVLFDFKLKSDIKIIPQELFTNKIDSSFKWKIYKSQDSNGFKYFFRYSEDGVNFKDSEHIKVFSPYYVNDKSTDQIYILDRKFLEKNGEYIEGLYHLVCYEINDYHQDGLPEFEFESKQVSVLNIASVSNPINAIPIDNKVAVFNGKKFDEWAYISTFNDLTFTTIHNFIDSDVSVDGDITKQTYKLKLISPSKNEYSFDILDVPNEITQFEITDIKTKAGIDVEEEGVWEIHFITKNVFDKSNESQGYYQYFVNLVSRIPRVDEVIFNSQNALNYFGIYSDKIGATVNSNSVYNDITNYNEYSDKFICNTVKVKFKENPQNTFYERIFFKNETDFIEILNPLTENDKISHSRDGRYSCDFKVVDPLNRESLPILKTFYIDTIVNSDAIFITGTEYYNRIVTLKALVSGETKKMYFKLINNSSEIQGVTTTDIKKWEFKNLSLINEDTFGIEIPNLEFEDEGSKMLAYVLEEESGNLGEIKIFKFNIHLVTKLIPLFDKTNKVYFNKNDEVVKISWEDTRKEVTDFEIMLEKIELSNTGEITVVQHYSFSVSDNERLVMVGPAEANYQTLGKAREYSFSLLKNIFIQSGYYRLNVKGIDVFNEFSYNQYYFQIDYDSIETIDKEITNNKVTIDLKTVTWNNIAKAKYYEISYDNKNWIRTEQTFFNINEERLTKETDEITYIYMRWISYSGMVSETSKIKINLDLLQVNNPIVKPISEGITENNKSLEWNVLIDKPEKVSDIYYSFNKKDWHIQSVTGTVNKIYDHTKEYPVKDGIYDVFVTLYNGNPSDPYSNKSEMVHSFINVFAENVPKPIFKDIINGKTFNNPVKLYISNKIEGVVYKIYVNGILVTEGYEISSSTLKRFDITVSCYKNGIDEKIDLLTLNDEFHIWSFTTEEYIININNSQLICNIKPDTLEIIVKSMPNKKDSEVILYKERDTESSWQILRIGDSLDLLKQWEFHISTFTVL